ncbi:MAG: hypothetical protein KIT62_04795 [Cyclobacteriaceae bacterium]|nr:hypothetical protein [Cyclobacteriaceae bacterium]
MKKIAVWSSAIITIIMPRSKSIELTRLGFVREVCMGDFSLAICKIRMVAKLPSERKEYYFSCKSGPMQKITTMLLITSLGLLSACILPNDKKEAKQAGGSKTRDSIRVETAKHPNGKLKSEVPYAGKQKHGLAKTYDKEGNIMLELPYVWGKREGQSKRYYEGGKQVFQTTEYKDDLIHGMQVKYRENGDLMSESRFEKNFDCVGVKEYYTDKTLKKEYSKLIVTPVDRLQSQGVYTLMLSMSEKVRRVKYYTGKLTPSGCLHEDLYSVLLDEQNKTGKLTYNIPPGAFLMEELTIIAAVETIHGNTYVVQRTHNLAIQN